ncbi:MAG: hypothetical protein HYX99_00920 [Chloroflexi bacterium]|nr:hypothetical protein [Chloroflexota bacterium]
MSRSKLVGVLFCIVAVVASVLFLWGIAVRNWWAIAVPVAIGFIAVMGLTFWIGWTMASEPPVEALKEKPANPSPVQKP